MLTCLSAGVGCLFKKGALAGPYLKMAWLPVPEHVGQNASMCTYSGVSQVSDYRLDDPKHVFLISLSAAQLHQTDAV